MIRVYIFLLLAVSSAWTAPTDETFGKFQRQYKKEYSNNEFKYRKAVFLRNLRAIEKHNYHTMQHSNSTDGLVLGINHLADMTTLEVAKTMNGYRGGPIRPVTNKTTPVKGLPKTVDWRKKGYVTGVKDQNQCGSCWAFSTTGSLEAQHFKATGRLVSLSEQNLMDCSRKYGNNGCEGGLMTQAFKYIIDNRGIDTEASYPYQGIDTRCRFSREDIGATCRSYIKIPSGDEEALKKAVATVGPVSVAIDASHFSFQFYRRGVYYSNLCSTTQLDHGVLVVGYGTYRRQDYWLVKNSWGPGWGDKGYIKMSRNRGNNCGIATDASYPVV